MAVLFASQYLVSIVGVVIAILATYHLLVFPFFLSPLRHIPRAHWTVPLPYIGSWWIGLQRYRQRNNAATAEAHARHGPVVRLGDNEIGINCYEGGLKTVYAGGWEKHEWYPRQFANFGVMNMFSTVGHHAHAQKKRIMANIYSKSFIATSPQMQANSQEILCKRFLPLIDPLAQSGESVDIHELNNAFTMDMMTAFQFGITHSTNFIQNSEVRKKYLHLYHSRRNWQFVSSELPPWSRRALQLIGISLYPEHVHMANEWLENWAKNMCDATEDMLRVMQGSFTHPGAEPIVFKQYRTGLANIRKKDPWAGHEYHPHLDEGMNFTKALKSKPSQAPDDQTTLLEVYSDMVDQLAAGHETSAVALTYLYHELSLHPNLQERLHVELSDHNLKWTPDTILDLPSAKDLDKLPFLNAVLMETLRLHAPIPGMQPRISPVVPGGVSLGPPNTKHEFTGLPENIRVSAMPHTLHKIAEIFPNPERFNPDRWLISSEEQLREMNRHFWAFGSGGRMCIGSHLAIQEIKLIVATVYTNYLTEIVDDEGIQELDAYTTRPSSGKLVIKFQRRG